MTDLANLAARLRRLPSPMCVHCDPNLPRWAADALDAADAEIARLRAEVESPCDICGSVVLIGEPESVPPPHGEAGTSASVGDSPSEQMTPAGDLLRAMAGAIIAGAGGPGPFREALDRYWPEEER